jgi:hypothetical protein
MLAVFRDAAWLQFRNCNSKANKAGKQLSRAKKNKKKINKDKKRKATHAAEERATYIKDACSGTAELAPITEQAEQENS